MGDELFLRDTLTPARPGLTAAKIQWVKDKQPEIYRRAAHILLPERGSVMTAVVNLQLTIFLITGTGFLIKRIGLINDAGQKAITALVLNVVLPCNIIKAFVNSSLDGNTAEYLCVFVIATAIQALAIVYSRIFFHHHSEGHYKCEKYANLIPLPPRGSDILILIIHTHLKKLL